VKHLDRSMAIQLFCGKYVGKGGGKSTGNAIIDLALGSIVSTRQEVVSHDGIVYHGLEYNAQVACLA
jgi:hypothetical protein